MTNQIAENKNIFPLTVQDISQIIKIGEQSNLSRWTLRDYVDEIERHDSICLVYKNNINRDLFTNRENIAGFIVSRLIISNDAVDKTLVSGDFEAAAECEILNIAVHPSHRRNGIGQQLFAATVKKCLSQNVEFIWLEVRKNNDAAVKFYQRNGFEVVYMRKNYYQNPLDDALVMKASLAKTQSSKIRAIV